MDILSEILEKEAKKNEKYKPTDVEKNVELEFDIGNLLACDTNELNLQSLKYAFDRTFSYKDHFVIKTSLQIYS